MTNWQQVLRHQEISYVCYIDRDDPDEPDVLA